ncbi:hypothetical protein TCAL_15771 [Tigriopus californicus]|uniref:BZIP domain-containing protein n=1 Tax=Tigriopus californicus TaxID=6832 RepID=A0A553P6A7_TIGCA|nr:hypothetical protein TCAL_15771 [Tigriopus californicus]
MDKVPKFKVGADFGRSDMFNLVGHLETVGAKILPPIFLAPPIRPSPMKSVLLSRRLMVDLPMSISNMETECYPCIPMHSASNQQKNSSSSSTSSSLLKHPRMQPLAEENITIKHEPLDSEDNINVPKHPQSLLKQKPVTHTILVTTPTIVPSIATGAGSLSNSSSSASSPTGSFNGGTTTINTHDGLNGFKSSSNPFLGNCLSNRAPITTDLISNQPADSSGILILTDEEKKTLISEGYPIPSKLPLTKSEEKSLKKIRRKIKNKISAQESRRKKKEFVDTLERQVEVASQELGEYKRKCEVLEKENASLQSQLRSLRAMVVGSSQEPSQILHQQLHHHHQEQLDIKSEPLEAMPSPIDGIGLD